MIEPKKFYSLAEIVASGYLVGVVPKTDVRGVRALLESKKIKCMEQGQGVAKRYYVKGEKLIEFVAKVEAGDLM